MPGRHSIYPDGVQTVTVPLVIAKDEADALWSIAPTRAAAVRQLVQDRAAAIEAVKTLAVPDELPQIYDAMAHAARMIAIKNAISDDATGLVDFLDAAQRKASKVKRAGLTTA